MRAQGFSRRLVLALWALVLVVPGLFLLGSGSSLAAAESGGAEAWVVRIEMGGTPIVEIGRTSVDAASGEAIATPLSIGGQGPPSAAADSATPEAREALLDWTDQTGSLTVYGGYAEASSRDRRWTARAGLGQGTGTGFAMASELLTWDQQTELLGAMQSFNDAITPIADQTSAAVAPLLALLGLPAPRITPMAPSGLVDVGAGRVLSSTAEATTAPGYATARADAVAGSLRLFGGFVSVDAVSTEATVQRGSLTQVSARSWLVGLHIAGIPVTVDANGVHVLGGGPFEAILTPIFNALLGQLAAVGVTVRTIATPPEASCCSAAAVGLEVTVDVPNGPLVMSLGGAAAMAPEPLPEPAVGLGAHGALPVPRSATDSVVGSGAAVPPGTERLPATVRPSHAPALPRVGVIADLGPDVVRAVRLTYLILLGAAVAGTAFLTIAGPARPARPKRGFA